MRVVLKATLSVWKDLFLENTQFPWKCSIYYVSFISGTALEISVVCIIKRSITMRIILLYYVLWNTGLMLLFLTLSTVIYSKCATIWQKWHWPLPENGITSSEMTFAWIKCHLVYFRLISQTASWINKAWYRCSFSVKVLHTEVCWQVLESIAVYVSIAV